MYFGEIEFPLFTETKWNKRASAMQENETGSPATLQSKKLHHSELVASKPLQIWFTQSSFPAYNSTKKGWKIPQLHIFNFLFLDVQESINEKLSPLPTSDVSAERWLQ